MVLHDWCNKGRGMCYPVCGMRYIKDPMLLIGKSSLCGGSGFPLSLSEWFFSICPTPNVLSASLNKAFPFFLSLYFFLTIFSFLSFLSFLLFLSVHLSFFLFLSSSLSFFLSFFLFLALTDKNRVIHLVTFCLYFGYIYERPGIIAPI